jgi:predicted metal-dependent HD superfamily phosphohydrolase
VATGSPADGPLVPGRMSDSDLRERFAALWARLGSHRDEEPFLDALLRGWGEQHRHYHGPAHLRDCLARLDESPAAGNVRDMAEAALWYHDVVYRPGAPDNEARSAELAWSALVEGGAPTATADEVARLVRLTDHAVPPEDPAGALVCDVDLSILGRRGEEFEAYERGIREEYREVPEPLYRAGRARVLSGFLARDPLFRTEHFRRRYEAAARRNLRRSVTSLGRDAGA